MKKEFGVNEKMAAKSFAEMNQGSITQRTPARVYPPSGQGIPAGRVL
jgi:hypothetical protein